MECENCKNLRAEILRLQRLQRTISLDGWKGKDSLAIVKEDEDTWVVEEHRQSKTSGNILTKIHTVPNTNLRDMVIVLKHLTHNQIGNKTAYIAITDALIGLGFVECTKEEFYAGKNRALNYFPKYYYPLKILESKGYINYSGRGGVTLLESLNRNIS